MRRFGRGPGLVSLVAAERLGLGGDHSRGVRSGSSQALAMDERRRSPRCSARA
ncbi:MAG: hypothetical protein AABM66_08725 [Actinomycetota bacterium]